MPDQVLAPGSRRASFRQRLRTIGEVTQRILLREGTRPASFRNTQGNGGGFAVTGESVESRVASGRQLDHARTNEYLSS